VKNAPVTEEELRRAKRQLVSDLVFARDSQQSMANIFGRAAMLGLSPDDVLGWVDEIEAATQDDVRDAARALLVEAHAITGHLASEGNTSEANASGGNK